MKLVVFALMCAVAGVAAQARAEVVGPEKAAEMLAHAWMIDNRCNVLGKIDRDVLTGLVARAEISLAEKKSVKVAQGAIGRGRATGTAAPCDAQSARAVADILATARSATASSGMVAPKLPEPIAPARTVIMPKIESREPAPVVSAVPAAPLLDSEALESAAAAATATSAEDDDVSQRTSVTVKKPVRRILPKAQKVRAISEPQNNRKPVRVVIKRAKSVVRPPVVRASGSAPGYSVTAENYYRELRCRTLSRRAVNAMYARVLREHRAAVSANGRAAVRRLLRNAETRASNGSC